MILQALLLVTEQAEPIKGLLTAVNLFVRRCPFLHSPVPLILVSQPILRSSKVFLEEVILAGIVNHRLQ